MKQACFCGSTIKEELRDNYKDDWLRVWVVSTSVVRVQQKLSVNYDGNRRNLQPQRKTCTHCTN